jgi:hypothetical protein
MTLVGTTNDGMVDFIISSAESGTISIADYYHFATRPSGPYMEFRMMHLGSNSSHISDNIYVYT